MFGGLNKLGLFKQPTAPKLKLGGPVQSKASIQTDVDRQDGDGDDRLAASNELGPQESDPQCAKTDPSSLKEDVEASKAPAPAKGRGAVAAPESAAAKAAANERPRPRARAPVEQQAGLAAKKPESQQVQPADGRAPQGGSGRTSLGRTGEEIWQFNLQLGRIADHLADPEDSKPARRKQKSPNLAENLQKRWGGTYSQMLDKNFDDMEVEAAPAPKYEPPLFLEDASVADDEEGDEKEPRPTKRAGKDTAAQPPAAASSLEAGHKSSPVAAAAPAPARARKGTAAAATNGAPGRQAAASGTRKAAACPLAAVAEGADRGKKGRQDADAGRDTACDVDAGDGQKEPAAAQQPDEDAKPPARRGGRKAKTTATEAATQATQQRPPARRTARGAGAAPAVGAAAAAVDVTAEDQGPSDAMDVPPAAAAAAVPSGAANPSSRVRRSLLPKSTAFGSTVGKPPLPPPSSVADSVEEVAAGGCEMATAAKRARDGGPTVDEKLRKTSRMDQQQVKESESLRRQKGYVDQIKQLQGELTASEKRCSHMENERKREASELALAQREIEKLKAKVVNLEDELKQSKAREIKAQRQVEQSSSEFLLFAQQQCEKAKGWRS